MTLLSLNELPSSMAATLPRATSPVLRDVATELLSIGRTTRSRTANPTTAMSDISNCPPSGMTATCPVGKIRHEMVSALLLESQGQRNQEI